MWYRIVDVIADRDFPAMGRVVAGVAVVSAAFFLGWYVIAF